MLFPFLQLQPKFGKENTEPSVKLLATKRNPGYIYIYMFCVKKIKGAEVARFSGFFFKKLFMKSPYFDNRC